MFNGFLDGFGFYSVIKYSRLFMSTKHTQIIGIEYQRRISYREFIWYNHCMFEKESKISVIEVNWSYSDNRD